MSGEDLRYDFRNLYYTEKGRVSPDWGTGFISRLAVVTSKILAVFHPSEQKWGSAVKEEKNERI